MPLKVWRPLLFVLGAVPHLALSAATVTPEPAPGRAIFQQLKSFQEMSSVLYVAAHPDDENTQLITYLARGRGSRTAYLSLTRGDGGQNEIGPEFGEKLGIARTQELLAARRLDGGRQFFTRAIDFGYSKSPEETLRFWDRNQVLADVVRVIRQFRPDVVVTRFSPEPGNTHGHHTASAILAREAFRLSGDPSAFPEQLREGLTPWQPKRIVWNNTPFGKAAAVTSGLHMEVGGNDPVTDEPFANIARRSRAMHITQGFGNFGAAMMPNGPRQESFALLDGTPASADIFEGVDTTWARIPGGQGIDQAAADVIAQFDLKNPAASLPALLAIRFKINSLPADPLVDDKRQQIDRIIQDCLGLVVNTTVPHAEVVPGEALQMRHSVAVSAAFPVRWVAVHYPASGKKISIDSDLAPGKPETRDSSEVPPSGLPLSQPYWLRREGTAGIYHVDDPALIGRPENAPVFPVEYSFEVGGQTVILADEPVEIVPNAPEAQARRRVALIPPVSLQFNSDTFLFSPGAGKTVTVELTAARADLKGSLHLEIPNGWKIIPKAENYHLMKAGDSVRLTFAVTAPAASGSGEISAVAVVDGRTNHSYSNQRHEIRYAHIPVQLLQPPARAQLVNFDLKTNASMIGYLPGAGDSVAECLTQMGCTVRVVSGADLTPEKLQGLDAVVIGVRAFNERKDLAANLPALFAWVEAGGTVVAQYNRPGANLKDIPLGPYKLSIEGQAPALRVTDETAVVTVLAPDHPVLNTPNKITAADFEGWVQERGAYFPSSWDEEHYTSIFAMNDPGEKPLKSSLLVAKHGKGYYVYTGLSFFRQLPAGNPGAVRLFANIISLGK